MVLSLVGCVPTGFGPPQRACDEIAQHGDPDFSGESGLLPPVAEDPWRGPDSVEWCAVAVSAGRVLHGCRF
jgi:hypothetical protein